MSGGTRKVWVEAAPPCDGFGTAPDPARHAYLSTGGHRPVVGTWITTLAGECVIVTALTPGRPAPECADCDRAWRRSEDIELREEHETKPQETIP